MWRCLRHGRLRLGAAACLLTGCFLYLTHTHLTLYSRCSRPAWGQRLSGPGSRPYTLVVEDDDQIVGLKGFRDMNCLRALEGSPPPLGNWSFPDAVQVSEQSLINSTQDCPGFRRRHGYERYPPATEEELDFPLAFNVLLYKDAYQLHVLLRAIYRPHNVYCLHVDGYASSEVFTATQRLAACLPGVFLSSERENVNYAGFSRLQADINCMRDHWQRSLQQDSVRRWRYLLNLASQEFPLKTNLELVKILSIYNGSNDVEGITGARALEQRFLFRHDNVPDDQGRVKIEKTEDRNPPAPHNFSVVKGSAYGAFSRGFVDYVLHDMRAQDLLQWSRDVYSPDEYFWATLHHNPHLGVPGGYSGVPDSKRWLAVYASWPPGDLCASRKHVRYICIFGQDDLPQLRARPELFANKFYLDFQPQTLHCLDQWIFNKSWTQLPFNAFFYRQLPFVLKH